MLEIAATAVWCFLLGLLAGHLINRNALKAWRSAALRWREAAELYERIR